MIVYGVALLSVCLVIGMLAGETLGVLLGVDANVGGCWYRHVAAGFCQ